MFAAEGIEICLKALDAQLGRLGVERLEFVVRGGSALNALGLISRVTKDIDVLATLLPGKTNPELVKVEFGPGVVEAINKVEREFSLPGRWINDGPASQVESGLTEGFIERLVSKRYGERVRGA